MKANLLLRRRIEVDDISFAELVVWRLPLAMPGSVHPFKYWLAYVVNGVCVLRYDNEVGKGDHRHVGKRETAYRFSTIDRLLNDFWSDVDGWR